jgi:hypothetical protein
MAMPRKADVKVVVQAVIEFLGCCGRCKKAKTTDAYQQQR